MEEQPTNGERPDPTAADLLSTPMLTVSSVRTGTDVLSLPGVVARLLTGPEVSSFPGLAAEQRGHWWRLLVRVSARALYELELDPETAEGRKPDVLGGEIAGALRAITTQSEWLLHDPDSTRPAFLQAPYPGESPPGGNWKPETCSVLTATLGGKNHERKAEVGRVRNAEELCYALTDYQFGVIYGGQGHYPTQLTGSASGAGSGVPFVGPRIGTGLCATFRHDVAHLLGRRAEIVRDHGLRGEVWALWTLPWEGETQLPAHELDPFFMPLARLVRVAPPDAGMFRRVWLKPAAKARVADHTGGGNLGDPFTPLVPDPKTGDLKVRGALSRGYDYSEVARLLFGAGRPALPPTSVAALRGAKWDDDADLRVIFEGLAFSQGKTLGFHRREVPLPPSSGFLSLLSEPNPLRKAHAELSAPIGDAKTALRGAARILLTGEARPKDGDAGRVEGPARALESRIDQVYLPVLFAGAEALRCDEPDEWTAVQYEWREDLVALARSVWELEAAALPLNSSVRLEREVRADAFLLGRLRRLKTPQEADTSTSCHGSEE